MQRRRLRIGNVVYDVVDCLRDAIKNHTAGVDRCRSRIGLVNAFCEINGRVPVENEISRAGNLSGVSDCVRARRCLAVENECGIFRQRNVSGKRYGVAGFSRADLERCIARDRDFVKNRFVGNDERSRVHAQFVAFKRADRCRSRAVVDHGADHFGVGNRELFERLGISVALREHNRAFVVNRECAGGKRNIRAERERTFFRRNRSGRQRDRVVERQIRGAFFDERSASGKRSRERAVRVLNDREIRIGIIVIPVEVIHGGVGGVRECGGRRENRGGGKKEQSGNAALFHLMD